MGCPHPRPQQEASKAGEGNALETLGTLQGLLPTPWVKKNHFHADPVEGPPGTAPPPRCRCLILWWPPCLSRVHPLHSPLSPPPPQQRSSELGRAERQRGGGQGASLAEGELEPRALCCLSIPPFPHNTPQEPSIFTENLPGRFRTLAALSPRLCGCFVFKRFFQTASTTALGPGSSPL